MQEQNQYLIDPIDPITISNCSLFSLREQTSLITLKPVIIYFERKVLLSVNQSYADNIIKQVESNLQENHINKDNLQSKDKTWLRINQVIRK